MKRVVQKKQVWKCFISVVVMSWVWALTASAIEIKMGGGEALDLARFQVVHKETFDTGKSQKETFWGALDVGE